MNYEEFEQALMKYLEEHKPEDITLEKTEVSKLNRSKKGITIHFKENRTVAPTFYPEQLYELYKSGESIGKIGNHLLNEIENSRDGAERYSNLNFEYDSSKIALEVVNFAMNENVLKNCPYRKLEDLAIVARYNWDNDASSLVTNDICRMFKKTGDEMLEAGRENMPEQQFKIITLLEALKNILREEGMPEEFIEEYSDERSLNTYMITNQNGYRGAVAMCDKDTLTKASEIIGGDFYILPSSRHEILAIGVGEVTDVEFLKNMVSEVNAGTVKDEDKLSDNVYLYDSKTKRVTIVGTENIKEAEQITKRKVK